MNECIAAQLFDSLCISAFAASVNLGHISDIFISNIRKASSFNLVIILDTVTVNDFSTNFS